MSDDMDALLAEYRAELDSEAPGPDRGYARLERRIDANVEPLELADEADETKHRGRWVAWGIGSFVALVLAGWGIAEYARQATLRDGSGESVAADVAETAPAHGVAARSEPPTPPPPPTRELHNAPQPQLEPESPPQPPADAATTQKRPRPARPSPRQLPEQEKAEAEQPAASPLIAEAKSLRRVRAALRDGDDARALELLRAHRKAFDAASLRDETDLLEADALCGLGRTDAARRIADRLIERAPRSPLTSRARTLCRDR